VAAATVDSSTVLREQYYVRVRRTGRPTVVLANVLYCIRRPHYWIHSIRKLPPHTLFLNNIDIIMFSLTNPSIALVLPIIDFDSIRLIRFVVAPQDIHKQEKHRTVFSPQRSTTRGRKVCSGPFGTYHDVFPFFPPWIQMFLSSRGRDRSDEDEDKLHATLCVCVGSRIDLILLFVARFREKTHMTCIHVSKTLLQ
jgi:hypothetical protein